MEIFIDTKLEGDGLSKQTNPMKWDISRSFSLTLLNHFSIGLRETVLILWHENYMRFSQSLLYGYYWSDFHDLWQFLLLCCVYWVPLDLVCFPVYEFHTLQHCVRNSVTQCCDTWFRSFVFLTTHSHFIGLPPAHFIYLP